MAEETSPTAKLYEEVSQFISGTGSPVAFTYIALDEGDMSAFSEDTTALATESTKSGLARAAGSISVVTTTKTNDTWQAQKTFTAGESATIKGAGGLNAAAAGDLGIWHRYAADVPLVATDQLQETLKIQSKKGA